MGAGSYAAGLGLAGHDPLETPEPTAISTGAGSAKFDPLTKTYPLTDDLGVEETDPVWQEVAHRLGIPLGALSSSPEVGLDVETIRAARRDTAQRTVEDAVNRALAPMIARGDVRVHRVVLAQPWAGKWDAEIVNLRDPLNRIPGTPPITRTFTSR